MLVEINPPLSLFLKSTLYVYFCLLHTMEFLKDIWLFIKERKVFWLTPIILVLLLLGLLIVFGGGSAVAPFIYTLF